MWVCDGTASQWLFFVTADKTNGWETRVNCRFKSGCIWTWGPGACIHLHTNWQRCSICLVLTTHTEVYHTAAGVENYLGVHLGECIHQLSVSLNLFVFHTPAYYTQPTQIKSKKSPKDPLWWGSAPGSFSLGWQPAECNKGLCYAALLQISAAKTHWGKGESCKQEENSFSFYFNHTNL